MGCFAECEPAPPITYEGFPEGCIDCLDNHILTNCMTGAYIGTTTTQSPLWEPEIVFSASNISGCFTVEPAKQAADISSIENIGVLEDCEAWPCTNFVLFSCCWRNIRYIFTKFGGIRWISIKWLKYHTFI